MIMQKLYVVVGSLIFVAIASTLPAQAERWTKAASVGSGYRDICVDLDSVKKSADGWTYFRSTHCGAGGPDPNDVTENMVRCNQDFAKSYTHRERLLPTPEVKTTWDTRTNDVTAPVGVTAR